MPAIPQVPFPARPRAFDQVFVGGLSTRQIRPITLDRDTIVVYVRYPREPNHGADAFRESWTRSHSLESFMLEAYKFIESVIVSNRATRRHPVICIQLDDHDGLAQTSGGIIAVSCKWLLSWYHKMEDSKGQGDQAMHTKQREFDAEIRGVLIHELVHAIQHDGNHTAPWWFIESFADYVRLQAGLPAPNWGPPECGSEQGGYAQGYGVGALFLQWIEHGVAPRPKALEPPYDLAKGARGRQVICAINARLEKDEWDDAWILELTGGSWDEQWKRYQAAYTL